ncbi:MAG TPA: peptidylprolyl isomerase SurA [Steroidobacteraceae bacterium]|nr:peptidylprolyl isomerase SurA [Steroidobacteraceae bacterium]
MVRTFRAAGRLLAAALLAFAGLGLSATVHAQTRDLATQGVPLDRIAAVVNDGVVLESEVDSETALVTERLKQQKLELPAENVLRKQVLDRLIMQQIEMQQAIRAGIKVSDEQLNDALQEVAQRNQIKLAQLPDALAAQGIDYASYRDTMRKELALTLLRQRDVLDHISVTPREIDRYLDRETKHPSGTTEYNISHILIAVPENATPQQIEQAAGRAQEVYRLAKSGEDFAKLAVTYSNSDTALEGGKLGWRKGTELPTFLADEVLKLKPGEVSEPIREPTGFHLVKLNDVRNDAKRVLVDQVHVRHILMRTNELQDDATVEGKLEQIRDKIMKNGADFAVLARTLSQDPGSAADGGDLGWASPDVYAPEFAKVVEDLKVNEISEPFHTQYGWHIVQLLGRRRYDSTEELKRKHAADEIRASKSDEETELWMRRLRDEAYVEYKG